MKRFERFNGLLAATFTPFGGSGDLNLNAIKAYADHVAASPLEGVFICGTTGEFSSMTVDERKRVAECWMKEARGRFKVVVHVGSGCQADSISLAAHAQEIGAWAIASIAPSFFKPADAKDLADWLAPIAAAAPELPFYYYNMPSMTGVTFPVTGFLREAQKCIPNLAGVKFTHNNFMEMQECINFEGGCYEILNGFDEMLLCGLAVGAKGGVGSTYNYIPKVYDAVLENFRKGDLEAARTAQKHSVEVVEVIIRHGGGVRGGKGIMKLIGIDCGECRPPFKPFTPEEYDTLSEEIKGLIF